jgi:ATP-dependent Lon protease
LPAITDYLAEAFHHMFAHTNRYEEVTKRIRLGPNVEGRDEKGIKKTMCALLKILHPDGPPSDAEFEEYVAYAVEARRRVKEQMNKRKPDDEFARINLSYIGVDGQEVVVYCPESRNAQATQHPSRRSLDAWQTPVQLAISKKAPYPTQAHLVGTTDSGASEAPPTAFAAPVLTSEAEQPKEKHFSIFYGDSGYSYESIFGPYLVGAKSIEIEDPFIRMPHQIQNFVRLCEVVVKLSSIKRIDLITTYEDDTQKAEIEQKLVDLKQSLLEADVIFEFDFNPNLHDREIRLDNGWVIKIGRGLDFYQKPLSWYELGTNDLTLRKCLETKVDIFQS